MAAIAGINDAGWLAESLRWTSFFAGLPPIEAASEWEKLLGAKPEASVSRTGIGLQQLEGPFGPGRLSLIQLPGRIDWQLNPVRDGDSPEPALPNLGPFDAAIASLRPLLLQWFEVCPPPSRIALGTVLIQPVSDVPAGYRLLSGYLRSSVRVDPEGSRELSYAINRPRPSRTSKGLSMNRLCKWSVAAMQTIQVTAGIGKTQTDIVRLEHVCRLELDLSTPAILEGDIAKSQLTPIFDELSSLGREIAHEGDIP